MEFCYVQTRFEFLVCSRGFAYLNALERGQYRLNSVGHNLVAHKLPNKDSGSKSSRRPVKKPVKKGQK